MDNAPPRDGRRRPRRRRVPHRIRRRLPRSPPSLYRSPSISVSLPIFFSLFRHRSIFPSIYPSHSCLHRRPCTPATSLPFVASSSSERLTDGPTDAATTVTAPHSVPPQSGLPLTRCLSFFPFFISSTFFPSLGRSVACFNDAIQHLSYCEYGGRRDGMDEWISWDESIELLEKKMRRSERV